MFLIGLKSRTAEVLRRASAALFQNRFLYQEGMAEMDVSQWAMSGLYFECHALCLCALEEFMKESIAGRKKWATTEFLLKSISPSFADTDKRAGLPPGTTYHYTIPRFLKLKEAYGCFHGKDEEIFFPSIDFVVQLDIEANRLPDGTSSTLADNDVIEDVLRFTLMAFIRDVKPMFTKAG